MKKEIQLCALTGTLLLSGCNLNVDFIGQGTVSDDLSGASCNEDCTKRSVGVIKEALLSAEAASGYQFYGFIVDYNAPGDTSNVKASQGPVRVGYGYGYFYVSDTAPAKLTNIRSNVTAVFLPEGSVQQSQQTQGSLCVLNQDQGLQCWGKLQEAVTSVTSVVTEVVAEADNKTVSDHLCALTETNLQCWNELTAQSWQIPESISVPTSAALTENVACVVYQGNGVPMLACLHQDGSPLANTPDIVNPEQIWVNDSGQFCTENSVGIQCWSPTHAN